MYILDHQNLWVEGEEEMKAERKAKSLYRMDENGCETQEAELSQQNTEELRSIIDYGYALKKVGKCTFIHYWILDILRIRTSQGDRENYRY